MKTLLFLVAMVISTTLIIAQANAASSLQTRCLVLVCNEDELLINRNQPVFLIPNWVEFVSVNIVMPVVL